MNAAGGPGGRPPSFRTVFVRGRGQRRVAPLSALWPHPPTFQRQSVSLESTRWR